MPPSRFFVALAAVLLTLALAGLYFPKYGPANGPRCPATARVLPTSARPMGFQACPLDGPCTAEFGADRGRFEGRFLTCNVSAVKNPPATVPLLKPAVAVRGLQGPAPKAPLAIKGDLKVKACRLVRLELVGVPEGAAVTWDISPEEKADYEEQGARLIMTGEPGEYRVKARAWTSRDGKLTAETTRAVVTIEPCCPPGPERPAPPAPPGKPPEGKADPMNARCKILFGNAGCTATVISPRRKDGRWDVLTAAHCISKVGQKGKATMAQGKTFGVTVSAVNKTADLAWLVTDTDPGELPYAILAKELPPAGTAIWHAGYGIDRPGNVEKGKYVGPARYPGMIRVDISMSSGDSGSSFFREDNGESVGTMYGTIGGLGHGGSCVAAWVLRPVETSDEEGESDERPDGESAGFGLRQDAGGVVCLVGPGYGRGRSHRLAGLAARGRLAGGAGGS